MVLPTSPQALLQSLIRRAPGKHLPSTWPGKASPFGSPERDGTNPYICFKSEKSVAWLWCHSGWH